MHDRPPVSCWLTDMDGVLVREERAIPGAPEFIAALEQHGRRFLVLTNNSIFTARDLRARLLASGIDVPENAIWTSALATAQFLADQAQGGSAYVIGEAGLTSALHRPLVENGGVPAWILMPAAVLCLATPLAVGWLTVTGVVAAVALIVLAAVTVLVVVSARRTA